MNEPIPHVPTMTGVYARALTVVGGAFLLALSVALKDDHITKSEWCEIGVAVFVAWRAWLDQSKANYDAAQPPTDPQEPQQ